MRKIYVAEPKIAAPQQPTEVIIVYGLVDWEEGMIGIIHLPGQDDACHVNLLWGEGIVELRQKAIDAILAFFPDVTSNDIIFLGGWN